MIYPCQTPGLRIRSGGRGRGLGIGRGLGPIGRVLSGLGMTESWDPSLGIPAKIQHLLAQGRATLLEPKTLVSSINSALARLKLDTEAQSKAAAEEAEKQAAKLKKQAAKLKKQQAALKAQGEAITYTGQALTAQDAALAQQIAAQQAQGAAAQRIAKWTPAVIAGAVLVVFLLTRKGKR